MALNRWVTRIVISHLRLRFIVGLGVLLVIFAGLTAAFLFEWQRGGDLHAQAFGNLLCFFAASITAVVTLVYLHISRRSLATAESAIDLQREQWEMRMTVKPRFWLVPQPENIAKPIQITYRHDVAEGYVKGSGNSHHYYSSLDWPVLMLDVWNDGERSMRVSSLKMWVRGESGLSITRPMIGFVVAPNELKHYPVTEEVAALVFRRRTFEPRFERAPCDETVIGVRLYYSDWRDDDHASHDMYYLVLTEAHARGGVHVEHVEPRELL
jgi:hypothetical protein